jgi:hypothetical protein
VENQRSRSPRYPSISLKEAVTMARKIYDRDSTHAIDRESAVQHIGYSTLNGASATALASLKQFGLTADTGKGMLRLTDLALDILEPQSDAEFRAGLAAAAFAPDLFASLRERFPDRPPSESSLRAHLVRQGFTATAVKSIVPAYLETYEYAESLKETESHSHTPTGVQESALYQSDEDTPMTPNLPSVVPGAPMAQPVPPVGIRRMVFDTEEGEAMFTYPDDLSEDSVDDLEAWFALVVKRLRRATTKQ